MQSTAEDTAPRPDLIRRVSRRQAVIGLAAGVVLLVSAPLVWWATQPEPAGQQVSDVGVEAAERLAGVPGAGVDIGSAPAGIGTNEAPGQVVNPPAPAAAEVPPAAAPAPDAVPDAVPAGPPAGIVVPKLGVDTAVVPVGVDDQGAMEIPQDVASVGWYRFGAVPGAATGSSVLAGHVDAADQGPGVFAELGSLEPGDVVEVVDDTGVRRSFSVVAREEWAKDDVPLDRLFDRGGEPRLVLITCGGGFDEGSLSYEDNIAITAVPVAA